jgi:dihydroorotate dehydrogenase electron transfer subunit
MITRRDLSTRVSELRPISPTCFVLTVHTPEAVEARPGQFAMVACTPSRDPLLRRAFSLAAVRPVEGGTSIELMVKRIGTGTGCLGRSRPGDEIRLLAPLGNGFTLDAAGPVALLGGGIGLPPMLYAAEVLASRGVAFDLYHGASLAGELLALDRCRAATEAGGGELVLTTDDGTAGEPGLVTHALVRRLDAGRSYARVLACGPTPMLKALARLTLDRGLAAELSLEEPMACGVGVCLGCVVELADGSFVPSCKEGPVFPVDRLAARWLP